MESPAQFIRSFHRMRARTSSGCSPECAADLCGLLFPSNSSARVGAAYSHTAWYSLNALLCGVTLCCLVSALSPVSEYLTLWCPQHPIACSSNREGLLQWEKGPECLTLKVSA